MKTASVLELQVINKNQFIKKGTKLTINCLGLINGLNKRQDGYTFFGYFPKNKSMPLDEDNCYILDFNLNGNREEESTQVDSKKFDTLEENNNNNNINEDTDEGRHFLIEYLIDQNEYAIRDLGVGFGTFVKLEKLYELKDNQLFSIGKIFIVVNISENKSSIFSRSNINNINNSNASVKYNQLKLTIYGENYNGDCFYFMPQNRNITIGRYELADISLNDKLLSNIHCIINYSDELGWTLIDGHNNKRSTNGTWIYIKEGVIIGNDMIFKSNKITFKAKLYNN